VAGSKVALIEFSVTHRGLGQDTSSGSRSRPW
jgi:hypothetical protein